MADGETRARVETRFGQGFLTDIWWFAALSSDVRPGISGFVQKPFTPADLASRMRVALDDDGRRRADARGPAVATASEAGGDGARGT